jgi:hypothetical protein
VTFVYQNPVFASETLTMSRKRFLISHWIEVSLLVIPTALGYQEYAGTSEAGNAVNLTNFCIYEGT